MACHLTVYDTEAGNKTKYICDEDNTHRVVTDDHAGGSGEYADVDGKRFSVDWTKSRLIGFQRKG